MKRLTGMLLGVFVAGFAMADLRFRDFDDPDAPKWEEEAVQPPAYPDDRYLREFYVSEATTHRFFVDESSLSVGKDGVVRYALVIRTQSGATNVSFEGIRCDTREFRIYAAGRRDGTWGMARKSEWRPIENKPVNRHHAALSRELFCPYGALIRDAEEARGVLRRGRHPSAD